MTPITFPCGPDRLVGSLHRPPVGNAEHVGIVFLVGGPQTRAGASRGLLHLAEGLCASGIHVLRFDWRGEGDSEGARRPFDGRDEEIHAAIQAMRETSPDVRSIFLLGLCDGASAALLHAGRRTPLADDGVSPSGLILINPWMRDDDLRPPLGSPGRLPVALLTPFHRMRRSSVTVLESRLLEAARRARPPVLWLTARNDPTGRDALIRLRASRWQELREKPSRLLSWAGDDHVLALPDTRIRIVAWIRRWLTDLRVIQGKDRAG
ncbi:MAG: alpha/beta fold hydrolase [Alphaproteobacteria bacterium]|nr:MAG: alpha/beta fold hydrolase [Alphaproteobacteria bacterium]